jgi:hypothetical protein
MILLLGASSCYTAIDWFLPQQLFGFIEARSSEVLTAKIMKTTGDANK